jgi:hypothetical protein
MSIYKIDRASRREIKEGKVHLEWLQMKQQPETFRKWAEAATAAEKVKNNGVVRLAEVILKGKDRPAIVGHQNSQFLLNKAHLFGDLNYCGEFVKFSELPDELRRKIWLYATPGRRVLEAFVEIRNGVFVSRSYDKMLLDLRRSCKDADTAVLSKYHKLWLQDLFPITAPNFKTVLINYKNDIFHFTSSGAMEAALGKFGNGRVKELKNVGFLLDHLIFWIKYSPDDLAKFLLKLESVETIVLEAKEPGVQTERKGFEGMDSVYDWLDLVDQPPNAYYAMMEEIFRAYIETIPDLYERMRGIRIWFFLPKSMIEKRFNRTLKSLVSMFIPISC